MLKVNILLAFSHFWKNFPTNPLRCSRNSRNNSKLFVSASDITNDDLVSMYLSSCSKHGTFPIPEVLDQICVSVVALLKSPHMCILVARLCVFVVGGTLSEFWVSLTESITV